MKQFLLQIAPHVYLNDLAHVMTFLVQPALALYWAFLCSHMAKRTNFKAACKLACDERNQK